jgi:multiple sugar transport system permease protein
MTSMQRRRPLHLDEHPLWWLLPILVLLAVFYLWPAIDVLRLSFTDARLSESSYRLTLESYRSAFEDGNLAAIIVATAIFVSGSAIVQTVFGLLIALTLQAGFRRKLIGVRAVQVAILTTWIIPGVSAGITWQLLLSEANFGFFNAVLNLASLPAVAWLSDPKLAIWSVTLANIWRGTALSMILLYAGLQTIPRALYEAAAVDGATALQAFRHITMPSLKPFLLINIMIVIVFSLNAFDLVLSLTGGGPGRSTEVLALAAYNAVFYDFNLAHGSVLAVMILLINLAVATAIWKIWR